MLPDTKPFRVCDVHQPLCPACDPDVHRDVGDIVEAEIAGTVGLLPGLMLTPMDTSTHKFQDQFRGDRGCNARQLQAETDSDAHSLDARLPYRTVALVAQRFPVPLSVSLRYTERLASTNNRLHIHSLGFILAGTW